MRVTDRIRSIEIMVREGRYEQALSALQRLYGRCSNAEISLLPWQKRLEYLEEAIKVVIPNVEL